MSHQQLVSTESTALVESNIFTLVEVAQAEILEQLTYDEQCDRRQLELVAEQAFYQVGKALAQLRGRRLYRSTHKIFAAYCEAR
ncbi:MAG: hypothetical protein N4J56_006983 [Chroococcidiopsis sp. SAG 2025]|uniref:hypothetical protein n=1 Tax=Chroococcidiopsis sp. SAG 2025 TaxID=171389 RepID=UPI0015E7B084|nr:hypothetical protein [Chroococcidiopsis sp. SAG 2025]MDV2997278.1 hypothetical protein [Chroococcidiopsis sp. SAG 2025]